MLHLYFWSILQNAAETLLGFTYRKLKINKGQNEAKKTFNTGVVVCGIHMLSKTPLKIMNF